MKHKIIFLACAAAFSAPVFSQTVDESLQTQINQNTADIFALNVTLLNTQSAATLAFNSSGVAESKANAAQATANTAISTANAITSSINSLNFKVTNTQNFANNLSIGIASDHQNFYTGSVTSTGNTNVFGDLAVRGKIVGQSNVVSIGANAVQIVSGSSTAASGVNDRITTDGQAPGGADLHLGGTTITSGGGVGTTPVNVQVDGVLITNNGINASGTKITNVAAGTVSATSTDAVNGSQLNALVSGASAKIGTLTGGVGKVPMVGEQPDATSYAHALAQSAWLQSIEYTDGRANYLQGQINQNTADIATLKTGFANQQNQINQLNGGVAMAGAMAQLRINPTQGDGVYGAAGVATFNGSNAISAGLIGVIGDISISGSVALTSGSSASSMFGVGISKKLF